MLGSSGTGFFGIQRIFSLGSYSYSFSSLPLGSMTGAYCSIAGGLELRGITHPYERFTTCPIVYDNFSPIYPKDGFPKVALSKPHKLPVIESDVWIGGGVMLAPNISLGTGCVIAARANVTKSVPPYAIAGGNPAKIIKYRFNAATIEELVASHWWEYDISHLPLTGGAGPEEFLEVFYNNRDSCSKLATSSFMGILDKLNIPYEKL